MLFASPLVVVMEGEGESEGVEALPHQINAPPGPPLLHHPLLGEGEEDRDDPPPHPSPPSLPPQADWVMEGEEDWLGEELPPPTTAAP